MTISKEFAVATAVGSTGLLGSLFCAAVGVGTAGFVFGVGIAAGVGALAGYRIAKQEQQPPDP